MSVNLGDVARLLHVRLLLQHGSTVSGRAHAGSDVDLAGSTRGFSELKMYAYRRYQDHKRFLAMEPVHVARVLGRLSAR